MRERAKQIGGVLSIQSIAGQGTIVNVSVPILENSKILS
jgi:signal transduction histidine kinase